MSHEHESKQLAAPTPLAVLNEVCSHLEVAVRYSLPSDDQINLEHVRQALALAKLLREAQRAA